MTDQLEADELGGADDELLDDGPETALRNANEPDETRAARRTARRLNRWDRPPAPRDWRFYVGNLGRVMIATGLLLFGFVAYQLWGTGIETARAQNQLENEFEQLLGAIDTTGSSPDQSAAPAADDRAGQDTDEGGAAVDDAVDDPADDPAEITDDASERPVIVAGDITTAVPIAVDLADQAVEQTPIPQPFRGDPLLRLEIPAIGRDDIVVPGVLLDDLKDGPGHYPDTPLPGQLGNAAIAGHRTTYGAPFFDVDDLVAGDEIITTLLNGDRFVYEVTFVEVVSASDYHVVTTKDPNIAELTLTSCHPKYTARDRIVVHSILNPDRSSTVGFPTFYALDSDGDSGPIPGDDPVISADDLDVTEPNSARDDLAEPPVDDVATDGAADDAAEGATDPVADETNDEPDAIAADSGRAEATPVADPVDAFSQGWFDDRSAFGQIVLWGLALAIIAAAAYQLAKRYRRVSIGVLVGITPFLVALYFFYQNVNRLLPPGI